MLRAAVSLASIAGWRGTTRGATPAEPADMENLLPIRSKKIRISKLRNKVLAIVFAPLTVLGQSPAWSTRHPRESWTLNKPTGFRFVLGWSATTEVRAIDQALVELPTRGDENRFRCKHLIERDATERRC